MTRSTPRVRRPKKASCPAAASHSCGRSSRSAKRPRRPTARRRSATRSSPRRSNAPARQIADNAGQDGAVVVAEILDRGGKIGYDARKGEYVDMLKAGIIDPAKVCRTALENAASVAGLMLTTQVLVTDLKDDKKEVAGSVR